MLCCIKSAVPCQEYVQCNTVFRVPCQDYFQCDIVLRVPCQDYFSALVILRMTYSMIEIPRVGVLLSGVARKAALV